MAKKISGGRHYGKTAVTTCGGSKCKSEYQDSKYGKNRRVHNLVKREGKLGRCTVCVNQQYI